MQSNPIFYHANKKELDMLKMFKSPLTCGAREINIIRKKLKERYTKIWREKIKI
jgi:hypothetical protein